MPKTAAAGPQAKLLAEVRAGKFRPVYLLFGPDVVAADGVIELLKKALVTPGLEPFDFEAIHAPDFESGPLTADEVVQHTRQLPFGSTRRLVVIRDLDALDRSRSLSRLRTLCHNLARTPDTSAVVLTCNPGPDNRDRKFWLGLFADSGLKDFVIDLRQPTLDRLMELVRSGASRRELSIAPDAAALLVEIAGGETGILRGELDKLASALEPGSTVSAGDIRRLVASSRECGLKEYVALFLGRDPAALAVLRRLTNTGTSPVQVIVWLALGLFDLLALKLRRLPEPKAWRVPKGSAARWSVAEVDAALRRLYDINVAAVTGHPEPEALLDLLTAGICLRPARSRREAGVAG